MVGRVAAPSEQERTPHRRTDPEEGELFQDVPLASQL
jgi:hypothetical protein